MEYDNYIVFLLGCDEFGICQKIRDLCHEYGVDSMYDDCIYVAKKFEEYDRKHQDNARYENFFDFLKIYEKELNDFLYDGIGFDVAYSFSQLSDDCLFNAIKQIKDKYNQELRNTSLGEIMRILDVYRVKFNSKGDMIQ